MLKARLFGQLVEIWTCKSMGICICICISIVICVYKCIYILILRTYTCDPLLTCICIYYAHTVYFVCACVRTRA
jgi:hypothetical protein